MTPNKAVPQALREEAIRAFHAYEEVFIERVVRRPGWRLDAQPLSDVLATDDPERVQAFVEDVKRGKTDLLNANIVW